MRSDQATAAMPVGQREPLYLRWNLWRNPFGELTRGERAELAVFEIEPWLEALRNPLAVCQFIGPCGHGKSTRLLCLQRHLREAHYVYLPEEGPQPAIPPGRPLLIDEAQRLGRWKRRRIWKQPGPLVLGTHVDFSRELQRAGRHVLTDFVSEPSPERIAEIFNRRIEASRRSPGDLPRISIEQVVTLQQKCGADVRAMEDLLYHQFQHLPE